MPGKFYNGFLNSISFRVLLEHIPCRIDFSLDDSLQQQRDILYTCIKFAWFKSWIKLGIIAGFKYEKKTTISGKNLLDVKNMNK